MAGQIRHADAAALAQAVRILSEGGLVAVPTETVYGLAADATDGAAVAGIYAAKGRPSFNPLIAHVDGLDMAHRLARLDPLAERLAARFWPGPMTLVLPLARGSPVHPLVTAGLKTVALRMPRGVMAEVITQFGRPLAAPSANRSGRVSPTRAAHVARSLGAGVPLILDSGPTDVGLESTILKPMGDHIALLRPGGLPAEEVEAALGLPVVVADGPDIEAPGQLQSHYAPAGAVRLNARQVEPGEHLIAFGPTALPGQDRAANIVNLSPAGDLREAAAQLFSALTALDDPRIDRIAVAPIPQTGLGRAINDRLRRAAAPR